MLSALLNLAIQLALYALLAVGAVYLLRPVYQSIVTSYKKQMLGMVQRRRLLSATHLRRMVVSPTPVIKHGVSITRHLANLLEGTIPNGERLVWFFISISVLVGGVVYGSGLILTESVLEPVFPSLVAVMVPYIILWTIKKRMAVKNSYDIVPFVTTLYSKYNEHSRNMYHAMMDTISRTPNSALKRAAERLVLRLQRHTNEGEAFEAVHDFARQTDTAWATELALDIFQGYVKGLNVESALLSLFDDITDVQKTLTDEKVTRTDNMAAAFFPIVLFPVAILWLTHTMSNKMMYLQFHTKAGLNGLITSAIIVTVGCVVALMMYKPKQDI